MAGNLFGKMAADTLGLSDIGKILHNSSILFIKSFYNVNIFRLKVLLQFYFAKF